MSSRERFHGAIAGAGSTSGVRLVVGRWTRSPLGGFADVMVETADGHRLLIAPGQEVADFVAGTYTFDEVRVQPVDVLERPGRWAVRSPDLQVELGIGGRTPLGGLLRLVPTRVATSPTWCALTDPVARVALRGVRTRGSAGNGRREWYGAHDVHALTSLTGHLEDRDLGALAPVDPPARFGFSSTPRRPCVTSVVTTVGAAR